jgi:Leucine-rich repeat (LRR) protein
MYVTGEVHLSLNSLTGTLPTTISKLSKLYYFSVRFNQITGTIPSFFGDLANLEQLSVYNNKMSGTIPPELGNLQRLGTCERQRRMWCRWI